MISKRVSLSRDHYAAGLATLGAGGANVIFTPLSAGAPPTPPPGAPANAVAAIIADRVFVSNKGTNAIIVRPVIPGSKEAIAYAFPAYASAVGQFGPSSQWSFYDPTAFAAAPTSANGITVPAGAVGFPIEVVCIGLVLGGTAADTLTYAAYGYNQRA